MPMACHVRLIVADCSVTYIGRGSTHLPSALRLIMWKASGHVSVFADAGHGPLNWTGSRYAFAEATSDTGETVWTFATAKEQLEIVLHQVFDDRSIDLADSEPGLERRWREADLQAWLSTHVEQVFGPGWRLVGREYPTGAGPVDLALLDAEGALVAVEVKRNATSMGAVDQVLRYAGALSAVGDPGDPPVRGMVVALGVRPRVRAYAEAHRIQWLEVSPDGHPATLTDE